MDKSIGFCSMEKFDNRDFNSVGSSRIRARWLLPYWDEAEEYVIGKKYDVLIFQKVYWSAMMKAFEGIKILDLCDPDWLEGKPVFEFVDMADAITTSTEALADYIRRIRPNAFVKCVPDRVNLREVLPMKDKHSGPLRNLVWFGYPQNTHYLYSAFEELIKRGLNLIALSSAPLEPPLIYKGKVKIENIPYAHNTINKEIIKGDAVLMPDPVGDERSKYKSNNKTLHAWALRMPVVKVPEDLDKFMDAAAREEEATVRRKEIEEKWDVRYSVDDYKAIIEEVKKRKGV